MRTNIEIDDDLLAEAQAVAGTDTKRATVHYALEELVRRRSRRRILELRGRVEWVGDLERVAARPDRMIVVDTTVWVDFFNGRDTPHVDELVHLIEADEGIALTDVILTDVLHGIRSDKDYRDVGPRLDAYDVLRLETLDDFRRAAELYRTARRRGVTVRKTIDCLIASVCIRETVAIHHNDTDFDHLARCSDLRIHRF